MASHFSCIHYPLLFPFLAGSLWPRHSRMHKDWQCHCCGFWLYLIWTRGIYCNSLVPSPGSSLGHWEWQLPESAFIPGLGWLWERQGNAAAAAHTLLLEPAGQWDRSPLCSHFAERSVSFPSFRAWSCLHWQLPDSNFPLFPFTSFFPRMLHKRYVVLQGTPLPVMPAVWGWCACAPDAWRAASSPIAGVLPKMATLERSSMSAGSAEVCLPRSLEKHLAPECLPPEPNTGWW